VSAVVRQESLDAARSHGLRAGRRTVRQEGLLRQRDAEPAIGRRVSLGVRLPGAQEREKKRERAERQSAH